MLAYSFSFLYILMWFIKKAMDSFRKFNMVDAFFFELYLFAAGIVIAKLLPVVLTLNIWVYVIVVILWLLIVLPPMFKKTNKKLWMMRNFTSMSMWKVSVYKILVIVAAFLVLKLIPVMLLLNIAWYVAIACFGLGYLMAAMFRK